MFIDAFIIKYIYIFFLFNLQSIKYQEPCPKILDSRKTTAKNSVLNHKTISRTVHTNIDRTRLVHSNIDPTIDHTLTN